MFFVFYKCLRQTIIILTLPYNSTHFPWYGTYLHGKWQLKIVKNRQKSSCFVIALLQYLWLITFNLQYPKKWALFGVCYAESESKFANISSEIRAKIENIFMGETRACGTSIHEKSKVRKSHATVPLKGQ